MNLIKLSNIFYEVANQSGLNRYHFGFPNLFAHAIGGSFPNKDIQAQGQLYPALIFEPPNFSFNSNQVQAPRASIACVLWFGAQLDADYTPKTHLEQQDALVKIARTFVSNLQAAGQQQLPAPAFGFDGGLIQFETDFGLFLDRLITVRVNLPIFAALDCIAPDFDAASVVGTWPPSATTDIENV